MGKNGTDGTGWDGIERDRTGRDRIGRDVGLDGMWDWTRREGMG